MTGVSLPNRYELIEYIKHDEADVLHGEGILTDLRVGHFLLRVEARADELPGNWFHGPFQGRADATGYARYLVQLGKSGIRRENALPMVWDGGRSGNAIDVIRLYQVIHPTPAISSVVAPKRESGTVIVTERHRQAAHAGDPVLAAEYAGQGQQLSVPVTRVRENHEVELVRRVPGGEIAITMP